MLYSASLTDVSNIEAVVPEQEGQARVSVGDVARLAAPRLDQRVDHIAQCAQGLVDGPGLLQPEPTQVRRISVEIEIGMDLLNGCLNSR